MKKTVIASLVGGILFFFWQFLSWAALDLHRPMQEYSPKQAEVLDYLSKNLEEGFYFMPTVPSGTSSEEAQKNYEASMGKPWAQIYYHNAMKNNMAMNMIRGLIAAFFVVFLVVWIINKIENRSFVSILSICLMVGLISYTSLSYTNSIWYETKSLLDLRDAVVSWGLIGIWLGWYLKNDGAKT
jgi:hypothetical protein